MTPISFALEILLDCETIEKAHKACRRYIKEFEKTQGSPQPARPTPAIHAGPQQSPSTLALMAKHGMLPDAPAAVTIPPAAIPAIRTPPAVIDKETGRAMIQTGNGTKGPRKF